MRKRGSRGRIPVSEPLFKGNEKRYLAECISGGWVSSDGPFVGRFEEAFAKWSGNLYAVAVSSGTAALETALWALNITSVCVPVSTIISCYLAPYRLRMETRFYQNSILEYQRSEEGRNVIACHLFGQRCESYGSQFTIDDLSQYWAPFKIKTVGCYSLYANKLITSGEGGVIVTNQKWIADRCKHYRNLCHSPQQRFVHSDLGYNFRMSNLQAALALAQLEQIDTFIKIKQEQQRVYRKYLPESVTPYRCQIPWMHLIGTEKDAGRVVAGMEMKGIECRRFFYPLNLQRCVQTTEKFPLARFYWDHLLYLPSGLQLTKKEIQRTCLSLKSTLDSIR